MCIRDREYFISRENYHEKYEAALMDMTQCAFIRSEEEVTQNKVLDDGEVSEFVWDYSPGPRPGSGEIASLG